MSFNTLSQAVASSMDDFRPQDIGNLSPWSGPSHQDSSHGTIPSSMIEMYKSIRR